MFVPLTEYLMLRTLLEKLCFSAECHQKQKCKNVICVMVVGDCGKILNLLFQNYELVFIKPKEISSQ